MTDQRCPTPKCHTYLVEIRNWNVHNEHGRILKCPTCELTIVEVDGWAERVIQPAKGR